METYEILQCICLEFIESGDNGYVVHSFSYTLSWAG